MRVTAIILLFITGLNALAAGYGFITDPSGEGLGMKTEYLRFSFFNNFLIPGIILFTAIGLLSIVTVIFAIKKARLYPLFIFIEGCLLTGWIVVQIMLVKDFNWLHFTFLVVGLLLIFLGRKIKVLPLF
jgi:hypothetical protein